MRADDFGRFGDLMRRRGRWKGRQVLSESFIDQAVTPSRTNGCYGWLIWLNRSKPCVGPRVGERPVSGSRDFPTLPPDLYRFSGLFGQVVSVFPSQDIVVVRTGQESTPAFSGGSSWEKGLYERVLASVTDQRIRGPRTRTTPTRRHPMPTAASRPRSSTRASTSPGSSSRRCRRPLRAGLAPCSCSCFVLVPPRRAW